MRYAYMAGACKGGCCWTQPSPLQPAASRKLVTHRTGAPAPVVPVHPHPQYRCTHNHGTVAPTPTVPVHPHPRYQGTHTHGTGTHQLCMGRGGSLARGVLRFLARGVLRFLGCRVVGATLKRLLAPPFLHACHQPCHHATSHATMPPCHAYMCAPSYLNHRSSFCATTCPSSLCLHATAFKHTNMPLTMPACYSLQTHTTLPLCVSVLQPTNTHHLASLCACVLQPTNTPPCLSLCLCATAYKHTHEVQLVALPGDVVRVMWPKKV